MCVNVIICVCVYYIYIYDIEIHMALSNGNGLVFWVLVGPFVPSLLVWPSCVERTMFNIYIYNPGRARDISRMPFQPNQVPQTWVHSIKRPQKSIWGVVDICSINKMKSICPCLWGLGLCRSCSVSWSKWSKIVQIAKDIERHHGTGGEKRAGGLTWTKINWTHSELKWDLEIFLGWVLLGLKILLDLAVSTVTGFRQMSPWAVESH